MRVYICGGQPLFLATTTGWWEMCVWDHACQLLVMRIVQWDIEPSISSANCQIRLNIHTTYQDDLGRDNTIGTIGGIIVQNWLHREECPRKAIFGSRRSNSWFVWKEDNRTRSCFPWTATNLGYLMHLWSRMSRWDRIMFVGRRKESALSIYNWRDHKSDCAALRDGCLVRSNEVG